MTNNDGFETPILLMEPAGPTRLGEALLHAGRPVEHLTASAVDEAAPRPDALSALTSKPATHATAVVIAVDSREAGGVSVVEWESMVHEPLRRAFTALRGLVPGLLARAGESRVVMVMPSSALIADPKRAADSVLGRCLIGLAEGLRAELLRFDFPVSIVMTEPEDDERSLAQRMDEALRSGSLYVLPPSISTDDISAIFDPWLDALADTPADLALPGLGPRGEVYRAELQRCANDGRGATRSVAGLHGRETAPSRPPAPRADAVVPPPSVLAEGRTAIVTGGASGIGLGIAEAMLERGMSVVIADVREDHIADALGRFAEHGTRVMTLTLDVADRGAWREATARVLDHFGAIDVLCLNAGIGVLGTVLQSTPADWSWLMGVNLGGVTNGIETVLPVMRAQRRGGWVIATSSAGGLMVAEDGGVYSSAKYGVVAVMDSLRAELAAERIGATTLCPAGVNTNIHDHETMRPTEFSDSGVRGSDAELAERQTHARMMLSRGADPALVGVRVLAAVDEGVSTVFTDGGIAPIVRLRRDAIRTAIGS